MHYLFVGLGVAVLMLMWRRGWTRHFPAVMGYYASVVAGDLFFAFVCPWTGCDPGGLTYFYLYYWLALVQHGLKLAVTIGLYRHFLAGCPHLRAITDIFLYGTLALAGGLFLLSLDPRGSLIYLAAIHLGGWVYLLLATVCAGLLLLGRITRIPMTTPCRFIIWAFLALSLPQALSFTLLAQFYDQASLFWTTTSWLTMNLATCLLGVAAWRFSPLPAPVRAAGWGPELAGLLVRLDLQTALVLKKMLPQGRSV